MTIKDARQLVLNYFNENEEKESISYDDFNKLIKTSDNKTESVTAILGALVELGNEGYVYLNPLGDLTKPESLVWVLKERLEDKEYTIKLNGSMAFQIASVVNDFLEQMDSKEKSDPTNLQQKDFYALLEVISILSEQGEEEVPPENLEPPIKPQKPPKTK